MCFKLLKFFLKAEWKGIGWGHRLRGGGGARRRVGNLDRLNFLLTQKCVLSCSQCTGLGLVSLYITLYTRLVFFILSHSFSRYVFYSNSTMTIIALLKKFHAFISTHKNVEEFLS